MKFCTLAAGLAVAWSVSGIAAAQTRSDWPVYAVDSLHTGYNAAESILQPGNVAGLALAWSFSPGTFETQAGLATSSAAAKMQAQPIVASKVRLPGSTKELVLAGDGNGLFYALDANSTNPAGSVIWYQPLGTRTLSNCAGSPRTVGIRNSAALDRSANAGNGAVYVAANGLVHGLSLSTGAELSGWPVAVPTPMDVPTEGFIHDSPTVVNGQLYVGTSSCSDTPPYWGRVIDVDTASAAVRSVWYTLSGSATPPMATGGGIWGWGGVAVDPAAAAGGIYVATGNVRTGAPGQTPYAEYLVDLSPDLSQTLGYASPVIPNGDNDYGSTPVVFQPTACGTKLVAALNKTGLLVVASIQPDGSLSLMQSLPIMLPANGELAGNVAWDARAQQVLVTAQGDGPAPFVRGLTAFAIDPACSKPLTFSWQTTQTPAGGALVPAGARISAPTIASGMAFFEVALMTSTVYAVATETTSHGTRGQVLWQSAPMNCLASWPPAVVNGRVFAECAGNNSALNAYAIPGH